jgi:hypothetical protein
VDERFFLHRYKSSSHAAMVAAMGLGGLFFYALFAHQEIRWDLAGILAAMVATKTIFMIHYRRND